MSSHKFDLGQVVITPNALNSLPQPEVLVALGRHVSGDWGDLDEHDLAENERALQQGSRLFSAYHTSNEVKFWIITEWDRSVTTILLPEDY